MSNADDAVLDALKHGSAYCKFIRPNELGLTGGHQQGFFLSSQVWEVFTPRPPVKGTNHEHAVTITWDDGSITDSKIKWYGKRTRSELRLTSFNRIRGFYALQPDRLGSLLVLIPVRPPDGWRAYVLDDADAIEAVLDGLAVDLSASGWALYQRGAPSGVVHPAADTNECISQAAKEVADNLADFPSTAEMSKHARELVARCSGGLDLDNLLVAFVEAEYELFRWVERSIFEPRVLDGFDSLESFLELAQSITQRRKARAGRSLESHVGTILKSSGAVYEEQPSLDGTRPDFIFPSTAAYSTWSPEANGPEPVMLAVKRTCKDRWRQVLKEGPRLETRYLLTLQQGISSSQVREITDAGIRLVVPRPYHDAFAASDRPALLSVADFVALVARSSEAADC